MHLCSRRNAPMARQVKAHESTGQMGANPEPLNLETLNGYIVVFRKISLQGGQIIDADKTVCTLPKFAPV